MPLFQLQQVTLRYGSHPLLDGIDFQVESGERVCLVGRNGSGKTSLMRLITGEETPNAGTLVRAPRTVFTRLTQEIPEDLRGTVMEVIRSGISPERHEEDWEIDVRLGELVEEMKLPESLKFSSLSGGLKRRVLLARALGGRPDILLLDEPTNHMDLDSILWLENYLLEQGLTLFFVTHDRAFLRKLSTRIVELDRGHLVSWACDYDTYLERKAAVLEAEEKQWAVFDKKLAKEEAWLRQGVKARRTRNEGRVRALKKMREERNARRERQGTVRLEIQDGKLSGQKVIEAKDLSFSYESRAVVNGLTTTIWRGDKIGIIGSNGSGKTTLLKLLLGQLIPCTGSVKHGTNLEVAYLDQLRDQINDEKTVAQNVAGNAEMVMFQGRNRHIHSYLQDFLFSPESIRMPAKLLSGGERNRLLLARLFLQPANVLVLDEPTNDLDSETMELLEDLLVEYTGTLLLVSHDRVFLDEVVTSTLVFEGDGHIAEYTGGYEDWVRQRSKLFTPPVVESKPIETISTSKNKIEKPRKFSNREQKELADMPSLIEKLESKQTSISAQLGDPEIYKKAPDLVPKLKEDLATVHNHIQQAYARWEELENLCKS
jgi:ATP-binding cassette subfamily F protein uup